MLTTVCCVPASSRLSLSHRIRTSLTPSKRIFLCSGSVSQIQLATSVQCYFHPVIWSPRGRTGRPLTRSQRGACEWGRGHRQHPDPSIMGSVCPPLRDERLIIEALFLSHSTSVCHLIIHHVLHVSSHFSTTHLKARSSKQGLKVRMSYFPHCWLTFPSTQINL